MADDEIVAKLKAKAPPQRAPITTIDLMLELYPEFRAGPAETEWLDNGHWIVLQGEFSSESARPKKKQRTDAGASESAAAEENVQEVERRLANDDTK